MYICIYVCCMCIYIYTKHGYVFVDMCAFKSTHWGNVQIYKALGNSVIFFKSHKNLAFYCKRTSPGWFLKNKNLKSCKHYQYRIVSFPFSIRYCIHPLAPFFFLIWHVLLPQIHPLCLSCSELYAIYSTCQTSGNSTSHSLCLKF